MGTLARLGLIAFTACLGACATPYAPDSEWNRGGYSEQPREPGIYQVWFVGNERTPPEKSDDLALLRAADLCVGDARPFMRLQKFTSGRMDVRYIEPRMNTKRMQITGLNADNTPYYPTILFSVMPGHLVFRTRSGLEVTCLAEAGEDTRDATEIAAAIRQRHEIPLKPAR